MDALVPLRVTEVPAHTVDAGKTVKPTVGATVTVTVVVAVLVQPFAAVPVTVYVVVDAGTKETPLATPPVQV